MFMNKQIVAEVLGAFGKYAVDVLCDWYKESHEARQAQIESGENVNQQGVLADYLDEIKEDVQAIGVFILDNIYSTKGRSDICRTFLRGEVGRSLPSEVYFRWEDNPVKSLRGPSE